jgi:hypothetical protein
MSMSYFQTTANIILPLILILSLAAAPAQQSVKQAAISVTINPPMATVHVGHAQKFTAIVKGTDSRGIG